MRFSSLYRISFYLMLFFATLTLSVDVPESQTAILFPPAVAIAATLAYLTVDRNPRQGLERNLSNWLALLSVVLVYIEYSRAPELMLLALAHWLVYLQLIKMFLPKRVEDDWFLFLLGLMQVLVGTVGSQSDFVGMAMGSWALLALWVLALFSLHRDALHARTLSPQEPVVEVMTLASDPYPGLLNPAFVVSALRVTATTVALGGVIFLAMPRRPSLARQTGLEIARHLTGFDEEIKLGQLGEILENDSIVMSIELFDYAIRRRIAPLPESLWRGVTMASYRNGRWIRQFKSPASFPTSGMRNLGTRQLIRQQIRLEATDSPVLFGLRPMLNATASPRSAPELNVIDGTIHRTDPRSETYDYRVLSDADPDQSQPGEIAPLEIRALLEIPEAIREPLKEIAERELKEFPEEYPLRRARALEHYLRSSGRFRYSLHLTKLDPNLDPVLDFLTNTREGHCGYFASGLALLLRSIDIPTRMVNGSRGGDWNELTQALSVRQKHAHSWVEALIPADPRTGKPAVWITLDPTPGAERNEVIAGVGGFATNFRQFTDLVRYIWIFYIVGYNPDRQRYLLYEPIRQLMEEARGGFQMMGLAIRSGATAVFGFRDFAAFISVRGFVVSFFGLLVLVGLLRAVVWTCRRLWRWYRGDSEDAGSLSASQVTFRRLTQLLAEFGLERPPEETQLEFAHRASGFLTGRGSSTLGVADVPPLVVFAYYGVRFGHLELTSSVLEQLDRRLDALEASLHANAG